MWNKFYRRARLYTDGERVSPCLHEVIPGTVTLRPNLVPFFGRKQVPGNTRTVFKEVNIVPPGKVRTRPVQALLSAKIERKRVEPDAKFAKVMMRAFKAAIVEAWDPDKTHIIQHSSGWDSRMISLALLQLKKEKRLGWLGKTIFVEVSGEHEAFRKVLLAQDWPETSLYVYREGVPPKEHHASSFEFWDAHWKLNGWCGYPMNLNMDPMNWLTVTGAIPSDPVQCQFVTGYGGNEIGTWVTRRGGLRPYADFIYYHTLSHYPLWGGDEHWIHPHYHLPYIRTWMANSGGRDGSYRETVVKQISPKIGRIPPVKKQAKMSAGYRRITKRMKAQAQKDYDDSWLGQDVFPGIKATTQINYHPFWGYWSLASFCEYLIEIGIDVKVGG